MSVGGPRGKRVVGSCGHFADERGKVKVNSENCCETCKYLFFLRVIMKGEWKFPWGLFWTLKISLSNTSSFNSFSSAIASFLSLLPIWRSSRLQSSVLQF